MIQKLIPFLPSFIGKTAPGLAAIATGYINKDPVALSAGVQIAALSTIEMAKVKMESEGRSAKANANGMEVPLGVSEQLQMAEDILKPIWFELLKNSMDPDFPHRVRAEDLELARTLHSSDFILVYVIGKFRNEITSAYSGCRARFSPRIQNHGSGQLIDRALSEGLTDLNLIETQANIAFGSPIKIPRDELRYSLRLRGGMDGGPGDLFMVHAMQTKDSLIEFKPDGAWRNGGNPCLGTRELGLDTAPDELTIFCATLTQRANRLWQRFQPFNSTTVNP